MISFCKTKLNNQEDSKKLIMNQQLQLKMKTQRGLEESLDIFYCIL